MKPDSLNIEINSLSTKVDSLSINLNNYSNKSPSISFWPTIIAALITATIGALLAQAIERSINKKRDLREINSKCVNFKIQLKDLFRRLAMYKFHAQYWWHIHSKENNKELFTKYYNEHLRSQSEARDTEKEIGIIKASFLAEVVKYEKLKGKSFNVDKEKNIIEDIYFEKTKTYSSAISAEELRNNLAEIDEKELRESYFKKLQTFQSVIDKMI